MGIQLVNVTRGRRQRIPIVRKGNQIKFLITVSNLSDHPGNPHLHAEDDKGNVWYHHSISIDASSYVEVETDTRTVEKSFVLTVTVKDEADNINDTKTIKVFVL